MASKLSFKYLFYFLLLILFNQVVSTSQFHLPDYVPHGPREPHYLPFKPKKNSTLHIIDLKNMSKTLWDSDYKIMSLLLKRELPYLIPYGSDIEPPWFKRRPPVFDPLGNNEPKKKEKTLKLYDNNIITVFTPPDEAFGFELWKSFEYQIVVSKFDREAIKSGSIFKGLKLPTCDYAAEDVLITGIEEDGRIVSINNVRITKWNIYNDGHLIIHGVEDFFDPGYAKKFDAWTKDLCDWKLKSIHTDVVDTCVSDLV